MGARFNKPPAWPQPPDGWEPPRDWILDPKWSLPPTPEPPAAPAPSSLSSLVLELGTPRPASAATTGPTRPAPLRPTPIRMIGWGALGVVLIVVAGITVGDLAEPPPPPLVDATQGAEPPPGSASSADPIEAAIARAGAGTALAALADLKVQQRGPSTGYARSKFGSALTDIDGNGCDQRNDILRRDLTRKTLQAGSNGCTVVTGTLLDPYTGRTLSYQQAPDQPTRVQIDHVVSLGDAWLKGARNWTATRRAEFNADPLNLLAVGANVTAGKRASDAVRWLPEATTYRCAYVARQVAVKHAYGIWVTSAERTVMARILTGCAGLEPPQNPTIALGGAPLADPAPTDPAPSEPVTMAAARAR